MNRLGNREKEQENYLNWYNDNKKGNRKNHYDYIRNTDNEEYIKFAEDIYNNRCAYCGMKYENIRTYEIDHFKPHSKNEHLKHDINNLVYSCRNCNRSKSDIELHDELHPIGNMTKYYYRDNVFKIHINKDEVKNKSELNSSVDLLYNKVLDKRYTQIVYALEEFENKKNELSMSINIEDKKKLEALNSVIDGLKSRRK